MTPSLLQRLHPGPAPSGETEFRLDAEEQLRRDHYTAISLIALTVMVAFGCYHWWTSNRLLAGILFGLSLLLLLGHGILRVVRKGLPVYRASLVLVLLLLLYLLASSGADSSRALWLFIFPLASCFLLGAHEGLALNAVLLLGVGAILWIPVGRFGLAAYPAASKIRFLAVLLVLSWISYWFEQLRQHYKEAEDRQHERLQEERRALEEALSKVKQLGGMLPICASCKKIRDDAGYWTQLEAYISEHSEAAFSHSICPDCARRLYPGHYHPK